MFMCGGLAYQVTLLLPSSTGQGGGENKMEKTSWNKKNAAQQSKSCPCKSKDKNQSILFSTFHQQTISSHFPGSSGYNGRQISYIMKVHAPFFLLYLSRCHLVWNIPLVSLGRLSWLSSPSLLAVDLAQTQPTGVGTECWRESADAVPVAAALATSSAPFYFYAI